MWWGLSETLTAYAAVRSRGVRQRTSRRSPSTKEAGDQRGPSDAPKMQRGERRDGSGSGEPVGGGSASSSPSRVPPSTGPRLGATATTGVDA